MWIHNKIKSLAIRQRFLLPLFDQIDRTTAHLDVHFDQNTLALADRLTAIEHDLKYNIDQRLQSLQEALGRVESRQLKQADSLDIYEQEYRVYSQWGEDGLIQFLIRHIDIETKIFVEFGVEDYREANTRYLLINNNWAGLVIDSSADNIARLKADRVYWYYNLKAVQGFVTKDNINLILSENGLSGDIGLLSIDIDGNDYWIWQAIDVISPVVVIIEYNYRFGKHSAVTIPYEENFERVKAHHSMIYFGASLKALCTLAVSKGYAFVGCNSNGVNAFFVRKDKKPEFIKELSPEDGYVAGQFCEAHDESGQRVKISPDEEQAILLTLPVVDVSQAIE